MTKTKTCPLCGGKKFPHRAKFPGSSAVLAGQYEYGLCDSCKSIICLSEVNLDYSDYLTSQRFQTLKARRLKKFFQIHDITPSDSILDYGCGNGTFLDAMKAVGYRNIQGYEPHHAVYQKPNEREKFSVIYLVHVLEHITDLKDFFTDMNTMAGKKSKLVVICPSSTRIPRLDPGDPFQKFVIHAPYHSFIPSDHIVISIFEKNGFTLKDVIHYDVVRSGFLANNNFSAVMQDLLGGTKEYLLKSSGRKIARAVLSSPLAVLKTLFFDIRDDFVSTFIFER